MASHGFPWLSFRADGIHRGEGFVDEPNREDRGPERLRGEDHLRPRRGSPGWDQHGPPIALVNGKKIEAENDVLKPSWKAMV